MIGIKAAFVPESIAQGVYMPKTEQPMGAMNRFLNAVEAAGNKLPHITMLFIYALVIAIILSFLLSFISFDYKHPSTG